MVAPERLWVVSSLSNPWDALAVGGVSRVVTRSNGLIGGHCLVVCSFPATAEGHIEGDLRECPFSLCTGEIKLRPEQTILGILYGEVIRVAIVELHARQVGVGLQGADLCLSRRNKFARFRRSN